MRDDYRFDDDCGICDTYDPCCDKEDGDDFGSWIPIIIIVFILIGGLNWFSGGSRDSCRNEGGGESGGWLIVIVIILLIFGSGDGKKGGFLGGLLG